MSFTDGGLTAAAQALREALAADRILTDRFESFGELMMLARSTALAALVRERLIEPDIARSARGAHRREDATGSRAGSGTSSRTRMKPTHGPAFGRAGGKRAGP